MEYWFIHMELSNMKGSIQNFKKAKGLQISHLLFADDMLVFSRANVKSFKGINLLLDSFANNTGLSVNKDKSRIYFSKGCSNKGELTSILKINEGKLPVKYLGLPLSIVYPKANHFLPLIDKLRSLVDGWKSQMLNFAGRLELIKSVFFGSLVYWFQTFKIPISVSKEVERIMANFLWKDRLKTMSWVDICKPKKEGGLGLRRIQDMCVASGIKLIWRLLNSNSMWAYWMTTRYIKGSSFWESQGQLLDSGTWKWLVGLKSVASKCIIREIGNGISTSLWHDPWIKEGRLTELINYQGLSIANTLNWKVSKLIWDNKWTSILPALKVIWNYISDTPISGLQDKWTWLGNNSGSFTLSSAWNITRLHNDDYEFYNMVWFASSTPKMSCCLLKGLLDRLPTKARLMRFGIIDSASCSFCEEGIETRDHLFFDCCYTSYIWELCRLKLKIHSTPRGNLIEEAMFIKNNFTSKDATFQLARLAMMTTVWHVWLERCRRIFQNLQLHKIQVFRKIFEDVVMLFKDGNWKVNNKDDIIQNWSLKDPG
jgi:hypothetical protein